LVLYKHLLKISVVDPSVDGSTLTLMKLANASGSCLGDTDQARKNVGTILMRDVSSHIRAAKQDRNSDVAILADQAEYLVERLASADTLVAPIHLLHTILCVRLPYPSAPLKTLQDLNFIRHHYRCKLLPGFATPVQHEKYARQLKQEIQQAVGLDARSLVDLTISRSKKTKDKTNSDDAVVSSLGNWRQVTVHETRAHALEFVRGTRSYVKLKDLSERKLHQHCHDVLFWFYKAATDAQRNFVIEHVHEFFPEPRLRDQDHCTSVTDAGMWLPCDVGPSGTTGVLVADVCALLGARLFHDPISIVLKYLTG
jgi:hypothetical protein